MTLCASACKLNMVLLILRELILDWRMILHQSKLFRHEILEHAPIIHAEDRASFHHAG